MEKSQKYIYSVIRNVTISNYIIRESDRGLCIMCNDTCALVENVNTHGLQILGSHRAD